MPRRSVAWRKTTILHAVYGTFPVVAMIDRQNAAIIQGVETILADPASPDVPRLEAEIDELVFDLYNLTKTERQLVLATRAESCEDETPEENQDDSQTTSTTEPTPEISGGRSISTRKAYGRHTASR